MPAITSITDPSISCATDSRCVVFPDYSPSGKAMNPERLQQVKDIFQSAMDVEAAQRPEFVTRACSGDIDLQRDVESLLEAEQNAAAFIDQPVFSARAFQDIIRDADPMIGRRLGSYRLEWLLGFGGMGTVYLAKAVDALDLETPTVVAIKMISRGMDTAAVIRRFRTEQEILAALDHPYIARLFDGGTTNEGLPYFVMEYIE